MSADLAVPEPGAQLDRDGYAIIDLLDDAAVGRLRELRAAARGDLEGYAYSATLMSHDRRYRRDIHEGISDVLAARLRRVLHGHRLCHGNLTIKAPCAPGSAVPLHQDWSFVDESRHRAVAFWCPLVDVDTRNGALTVVPRSFLLNSRPRSTLVRFPYPELARVISGRYAVPQFLRAGQAVLFDSRLVHSSPPNLGGSERVAVAGLLVPDSVPLRLYYAARELPDVVRVYQVPDDFFLSYQLHAAPAAELEQIDEFGHAVDQLDLARLRQCLGPGPHVPR